MEIKTLSQAETILLTAPGQYLYLIDNPEGKFEFSLETPEVELFVLLLKKLSSDTEKHIEIIQHHRAPRTRSEVLVKVLLEDQASFSYRGMIHIESQASSSIASQEARGLLLSSKARFEAVPSLEILPQDVQCHHKASSGPLDQEAVFTLQTRGLETSQAENILEKAFLTSGLDKLHEWNMSEKE